MDDSFDYDKKDYYLNYLHNLDIKAICNICIFRNILIDGETLRFRLRAAEIQVKNQKTSIV